VFVIQQAEGFTWGFTDGFINVWKYTRVLVNFSGATLKPP
jgi:hypothetical protein